MFPSSVDNILLSPVTKSNSGEQRLETWKIAKASGFTILTILFFQLTTRTTLYVMTILAALEDSSAAGGSKMKVFVLGLI